MLDIYFFLTAGCGGPEYCKSLWLVRNVATNKDFQIEDAVNDLMTSLSFLVVQRSIQTPLERVFFSVFCTL